MKILNRMGASMLVLTLTAAGGAARAQSMDYGSLQMLFGESVTTSATGTPQRASDVSVDMTIITADQIRRNGSRSIPELLSSVPGLGILQETATGFDIGVRGYNQPMQPSMLVLINGRTVFSDDYSRTIWENLPVNIDDIRQIEVVKGAASALFGSNAAHGVINIVTYSAQYDANNVATVGGGTQNEGFGDFTISRKLSSSTEVKLSAGVEGNTEFNTARRSTGAINEYTVEQTPGHFYTATSSETQIGTNINAFTEFTYSQSKGNEAYYSGFLAGVVNKTYSLRGGFEWDSPFGTIKSDTYLNHDYVDNYEVSTFMPRYHDTAQAITSKLEDQFRLGDNHTFRFSGEFSNKGFGLTSPYYVPAAGTVNAHSKITTNTESVGGMWLWHVNDWIEVTNAARLDNQTLGESGPLAPYSIVTAGSFNHTNTELSLNDGVVFKLNANNVLRVAYAQGVEFPSLLNYGFNVLEPGTKGTATMFVGNPALKPLIAQDVQLGLDHTIPAISSVLKTTIFYESDRDIISPFSNIKKFVQNKTTITVRQATNLGSSHGVGAELQLTGSLPMGLYWDLSYSYAHAEDQAAVDSPPGPTVSEWGFVNSMPNNNYRLLLGYSAGSWEVQGSALIASKYELSRSTISRPITPGYYTLGGRIAYKLTDRYTLALSGNSLVNATQEESPFPRVERQVLASLTAKF